VDVEYLGPGSKPAELGQQAAPASRPSGQIHGRTVSISGANTTYITFYGEKMMEPISSRSIDSNPEALNPASLDPRARGPYGTWTPGSEYFVRLSNYFQPAK